MFENDLMGDVPSTEFSNEFVRLMRNAMAVSYYKYGPVDQAYPDLVDAVATLRQRLALYDETGNAEYLVDVANFAMIEFMHPRHPTAHLEGTDGGVRVDTAGKSGAFKNDGSDLD